MNIATLIREDIPLRLAYGFRGFVCHHQGGEHGSTQADEVLEKELRVPRLDQHDAKGECVLHWAKPGPKRPA